MVDGRKVGLIEQGVNRSSEIWDEHGQEEEPGEDPRPYEEGSAPAEAYDTDEQWDQGDHVKLHGDGRPEQPSCWAGPAIEHGHDGVRRETQR
jgi:hypothetical protein